MDNNIGNKLKALGLITDDEPTKTDASKANLQDKIDLARKYIKDAHSGVGRIDDAPDEEVSNLIIRGVVSNYIDFCECVKDILLAVCKHQQIKLSDKESFSELIRKTNSEMNIPKIICDATTKLLVRNSAVHKYLERGAYNQEIISYIISNYNEYLNYINIIEKFCTLHKIV